MQGYDLKNVVAGDNKNTNFHAQLFRLILKADEHNLELLRQGFPNAVKMVEAWRATGIVCKDLPYD